MTSPEQDERRLRLNALFERFKVDAAVDATVRGPSVTRYEVRLGPSTHVRAITGLAEDVAYAVGDDRVRVFSPVNGRSRVGIELPNPVRDVVDLSTILAQLPSNQHPLTVPIGLDVDGALVTARLDELPHLLVAGTTGSGKSTFINALLVTLIRKTTPERVRLLLVDPKHVELTPYEGVPHLLEPILTTPSEAIAALERLVDLVEHRYALLRSYGARNVCELQDPPPYVVAVIDELADLVLTGGKRVERVIVRLGQKARAAGVHLVLATQRPSADIITGLIKANVPTRLAFTTASAIDSRVILDRAGAQALTGAGDGLWRPIGSSSPTRIQAPNVSSQEIQRTVASVTNANAQNHTRKNKQRAGQSASRPPRPPRNVEAAARNTVAALITIPVWIIVVILFLAIIFH